MIQEEIDAIQAQYAAEAREIHRVYLNEHESKIAGLVDSKIALWEKYAAQYPGWAEWFKTQTELILL